MGSKHVIIMGTRGVPAGHGGFETFAVYLCEFLLSRGWEVTVYCQEEGSGERFVSDWKGVHRIHIPVTSSGPFGTIVFDWKSIIHSLRFSGVFLTLGYNTAVFNLLYRLTGKANIINMDGIEWKRRKWSAPVKAWFWLNERFGCWIGNHLVADHPRIADHLATRVSRSKITTIPYGAREIREADKSVLDEFGLRPDNYAVIIARSEPENSILEAVTAFSAKRRNAKLLVLGKYTPDKNAFHRKVMKAASDEVLFPGAIYEAEKVDAIRFFSRVYLHGHQVGGTNPSLVEALGAGNAVIAHDNPYNRWVAQDAASYFDSTACAERAFDKAFADEQWVAELRSAARKRFSESFQWQRVLEDYESVLDRWLTHALR